MLFSLASNFGELPEWHQVLFSVVAVASAASATWTAERRGHPKKRIMEKMQCNLQGFGRLSFKKTLEM
jgi:hypothetical protein